jgi:hypothetical protein
MLLAWTALLAGLVAAAVEADIPAMTVERFLERDEPRLVDYRAIRRLEADNDRFNSSGWLDVCTELRSDNAFEYRILGEGGSGYIRSRVLKSLLDNERQAWATGEIDRSGVTSSNYAFQALEDESSDRVKVALTPLRKDRMLVDGTMLLAREDGDLIQIDGRLAKSPSFWTHAVEVHRSYARIAGVRVPVAFESTANVRVAGRSTLRMTYQYLAVNGRDLAPVDSRCS